MRLALSLYFLMLFNTAQVCFAQLEANNWIFGYQCGLNFESNRPRELVNPIIHVEQGSAVISDPGTGELLFYTDGRNFWNRNHGLMQNTHALPYNCTGRITQPAIIIPSSENKFLYHVFCIRPLHEAPPTTPELYDCSNTVDRSKIEIGESGLTLFYYLIDMRLDSGMGNVVEEESNLPLLHNITQKLTAVPHANGKDHWILVHGWHSNTFYALHLSNGQVINQVTTSIGSVHGGYGGIYFEDELQGEIKASPNGKK